MLNMKAIEQAASATLISTQEGSQPAKSVEDVPVFLGEQQCQHLEERRGVVCSIMDSWEDNHADGQAGPAQQQRSGLLKLNPGAAAFSFNPGASTFAPSWGPPAAPAQRPAAAPAAAPSYGESQAETKPMAFVLSDEERRSLQAAAASTSNAGACLCAFGSAALPALGASSTSKLFPL